MPRAAWVLVIADSRLFGTGGPGMKYDVIVIGGGSAGSVVAGRLAEDANRSVLLLEAGTDYPDPEFLPEAVRNGHSSAGEAIGSPVSWSLRGVINDQQGEINIAQGKVIGGSGSINGQVFLRGLPEDFDSWSSLGNEEWTYLKVLPYYRRAETDLDIRDDFHGSDGPIPIVRRENEPWPDVQRAFHAACMEAGYSTTEDLNGPNSSGIGSIPMNNSGGVRMSTAITHLNPMRHRLNLTVKGNVFVRRVLIQDGRVAGVEAESGGEIFRVEADRVVLSAGALKSPHILMLSGVGPREQLEEFGVPVLRESPGVGRNLFNHPMGSVTFRVKDHVSLHSNAGALRFGLRVTSEPPSYPNDVMLHSLGVFNVMTGEVLPERTARIACALELPDGTGWVRLASADPAVQPSIDYRYLSHENDIRRMRNAVRLASRILESDAYRGVSDGRTTPTDEVLSDDPALDLWVRQTVGTSRHVSGTCKIGPDADPLAVVDQECRVKGITGLWVADSSVMPHVVRANTNATAIMIGERVADWVGKS